MILQEDTTRNLRKLDENLSTGSYSIPNLEHAWDINDTVLPSDIKYEEFKEWPNGHCKHVYREDCEEARKHMSNWAMRNTNNHNVNILKKSCLGVLVCSSRCTLDNGSGVHLRPAICDKARRKQLGKQCPNRPCPGHLELLPCRGHGGYPVTHFWRNIHSRIFFQAKGEHDHPSPEAKSSAEARRQRYAVKEKSSVLINRQKDRKRSQSQALVIPEMSVKNEYSINSDQQNNPSKQRRLCMHCSSIECRCPSAAFTSDSSSIHEYKAKDGFHYHSPHPPEYHATNIYYTLNQYNHYNGYVYNEKSGPDGYYQGQGQMYDEPTWGAYSYTSSVQPANDIPRPLPIAANSSLFANEATQYYQDNAYKHPEQYSPSCMYDPLLQEYKQVESTDSNTFTSCTNLTNSSYNQSICQDQQLSPPVADTYINLQRPNSGLAAVVTSSNIIANDTLHGNTSPYHHCSSPCQEGNASPYHYGNTSPYQQQENISPYHHGNTSPYHQTNQSSSSPSHDQSNQYLVTDSSVVRENTDSSVANRELANSSSVSSASFQLPAIVAAVNSAQQCNDYPVHSVVSNAQALSYGTY